MTFALRRLLLALLVMVSIVFISLLAQNVAAQTQRGTALSTSEALLRAGQDTWTFWGRLVRGDLGAHVVQTGMHSTGMRSVSDMLGMWLLNSILLLLLSMIFAGLIGGVLGFGAALSRRQGTATALVLLSIVGVSTPSFFLGMVLQFLEINLYRASGVRLLPVGGFGWDSHLVLPVLVLAARPIAQVARLTYIRVDEILAQDYVRTAQSKGLSNWAIWGRHVAPNAASAILTGMGTSLRFSLSSLPVVEVIFGWPGAGEAMLRLLRANVRFGATALALFLGALFVLINAALGIAYRAFDPRLGQTAILSFNRLTGRERFLQALRTLSPRRLWRRLRSVREEPVLIGQGEMDQETLRDQLAVYRSARRSAAWRAVAHNPALWLGAVFAAALVVVIVAGPSLAPHDPTTLLATMNVDGQVVSPPIAPNPDYPLGTDAQGRDILSLLLVGARRTMTLAALAVLVRLLVGSSLGLVSGWLSGSPLDRFLMGLTETLASFPTLLLAMLMVYAVGIKQGLPAFVFALAVVGWGEIMQTVRSQVISLKPTAFVEGAVASGASEGHILSAHILPNIWPTIVSLAFLEMGGVLMILGELGFLEVFIGGGIATMGDWTPVPDLYYYDVPEWSVMLANSWRGFRSFPWATLWPALAFFWAILSFNLLGEGLRLLTERLTLSLRTFFNRRTLVLAVVLFFAARWMMQESGIAKRYKMSALAFDSVLTLEDARTLADPAFEGRLSGSEGAERAAEWIAQQFETLGLQGAGADLSFFGEQRAHYRDPSGIPTLLLTNPAGERIEATYKQDFDIATGPEYRGGQFTGELVFGWQKTSFSFPLYIAQSCNRPLSELERADIIMISPTDDSASSFAMLSHGAVIMPAAAGVIGERYDLFGEIDETDSRTLPGIYLSPLLFDRLLASSGHSLAGLTQQMAQRDTACLYFPTGWRAEASIPTSERAGVPVRYVLAYWPGVDVELDSEAIIVAAYYDGLGQSPDGTLYPGANDNASGVAMMLNLIRTLKDEEFRPRRTLIFMAWPGGERHRAVRYQDALEAQDYFADAYEIVAAFELKGVGAGSGSKAALLASSSSRLTEAVQRAARIVGTPVTTRQRGLHADATLWPSGDPTVPSLTISWVGADDLAHLPADTADALDRDKLQQVGEMLSLAVMTLARDPAY